MERKTTRQWLINQPHGLHIHAFDDYLLLPPGSVTTQKGDVSSLYSLSPSLLTQLTVTDCRSLRAPEKRAAPINIDRASPLFPHQPIEDFQQFPAGEKSALTRLRQFCSLKVGDYQNDRDIPLLMVPANYHLIWGAIPRQCFNRLQAENPKC